MRLAHTTRPRTAVPPGAALEGRKSIGSRLPEMLAGAWVLACLAGMGILWRYKTTSGPAVEVPGTWPAGSGLRLAPDQPTLLLFVHPCCPCTRAGLSELRALLPRFEGRVRTLAVSFRPAILPERWSDASLLDALESLPGATVHHDLEGREAERFGVRTSGHVLLYGREGALRYSGGISPARGHAGDCQGLASLTRALEADLVGAAVEPHPAVPVYGCALRDRDPLPGGRP